MSSARTTRNSEASKVRTSAVCGRFSNAESLAEYGAGFRHLGNHRALLFDCDRTLPEDQQATGFRIGGEHGFASLIGCKRQRGDTLEHGSIGDEWHFQYPFRRRSAISRDISLRLNSRRGQDCNALYVEPPCD